MGGLAVLLQEAGLRPPFAKWLYRHTWTDPGILDIHDFAL